MSRGNSTVSHSSDTILNGALMSDLHEFLSEETAAGQAYRLQIRGISNTEVNIHYTVNGEPVRVFAVHLDQHGETSLNVSGTSKKGLYRFVGYQIAGTPEWVQAAGTIRVD